MKNKPLNKLKKQTTKWGRTLKPKNDDSHKAKPQNLHSVPCSAAVRKKELLLHVLGWLPRIEQLLLQLLTGCRRSHFTMW